MNTLYDMADIKGQPAACRALEIAAAGMHSLLLIAPPGAGKTMLARRLTTILPSMTDKERFELSAVHWMAGIHNSDGPLMTERPFRAPHHTVSLRGMFGVDRCDPRCEVSLAQHGCLFLDELPEFRSDIIERLGDASFANTVLIAAANPCACGYLLCKCQPASRERYQSRLASLAKMFDLVERLDTAGSDYVSDSSDVIRRRVSIARELRASRPSPAIPDSARHRSDTRITRIARTIADLDASVQVTPEHSKEASLYAHQAG